jgi:hypothetical protein
LVSTAVLTFAPLMNISVRPSVTASFQCGGRAFGLGHFLAQGFEIGLGHYLAQGLKLQQLLPEIAIEEDSPA